METKHVTFKIQDINSVVSHRITLRGFSGLSVEQVLFVIGYLRVTGQSFIDKPIAY